MMDAKQRELDASAGPRALDAGPSALDACRALHAGQRALDANAGQGTLDTRQLLQCCSVNIIVYNAKNIVYNFVLVHCYSVRFYFVIVSNSKIGVGVVSLLFSVIVHCSLSL